MATAQEPDFPPGHPARFDYDPASPEAQEWARLHIFPKGERDFPPDHPKAVDSEGSTNHVPILPGIDPQHPELEAFTGRTPEQAKAVRDVYRRMSEQAQESPVLMPVMAHDAPQERSVQRIRLGAGGLTQTFYCPGCKRPHTFDTRWKWNGSTELPSFTPSYLIEGGDPSYKCHSYVTNGRIQFLPDSTHELSGKTVDLPPIAVMQETIHA